MKSGIYVGLVALALLAAVGTATAETVTVTIADEVIDINPDTATIADLPGPDGQVSFAEAIIATNHTPGHQTIGFAIPQNLWTLQFLYPGRAVLRTTVGYYWRAYDAVTIDGTTQTAFTGDTNPDGGEVVFWGSGVYFNAGGCTLRGIDSSMISFTASSGLALENTGGMLFEVFGGSGTRIQNNTGTEVKIDRSNDNIVVGNTFLRVRVLGWLGGGQPARNNRIGGPNPEDKNYILGQGTWSSEGYPGGFAVQLFDAIGTVVENNWIGTTKDGLQQGSPNATAGISFEGENHDTTIRGNRIAGILGRGIGPHFFGNIGSAIAINGTGSGIGVVGNTIGLNARDEPVLGSITGIDVGSYYYPPVTDIRLGGTGPGQGNVIAGHLFNGITVGKDMPQVRIAGNSIYANHDLGTDLVTPAYGYGVTPNDPLDADTGGNGLQNFPEVASAMSNGATLRVVGALHSSPLNQFTIDFFASPGCDGTGFGEGQRYLASGSVSTNGSGNASFDVVLPATVDPGWVLTSTATLEPLGATSEFSACVVITDGGTTAVPPGPEDEHISTELRLFPGHPNPFRRETTIRYELPRSEGIHLAIYHADGRLVRVLSDADQAAGLHSVRWDGRGDDGHEAALGVYFYRLRAGGESLTGQVVRVR